jgi:hypothetical protein
MVKQIKKCKKINIRLYNNKNFRISKTISKMKAKNEE